VAHVSCLNLVLWDAGCLSGIRRWLRSNLPADGDLLLDAELVCTEFGRSARVAVLDRTWDTVCAELLGHYAAVCAGPAARRAA
jgi:hypothetical protein